MVINKISNGFSNTVMTNIYFRTWQTHFFSNNVAPLTYLFRTHESAQGRSDVELKGLDKNLLKRAELDVHWLDKKWQSRNII